VNKTTFKQKQIKENRK